MGFHEAARVKRKIVLMKKLALLMTLGLITLFPLQSWSCSCAETKLEEYLSSCKQLFTAVLYQARLSESPSKNIIGELKDIKDVITGDPSVIKGLKTIMIGTSCETTLAVGKRYLVCGNNEPYVSVAGCSKTKPFNWYFPEDTISQLKQLTDKSLLSQ